jgi:hypothetical protein
MSEGLDDGHHLLPLGVPSTILVRLKDEQAQQQAHPQNARADNFGRVYAGGRDIEPDAIVPAYDPDEALFDELLGETESAKAASRPAPIRSLVDEAVSALLLVVGSEESGRRELFQGPEAPPGDSGPQSLGLLGRVCDAAMTSLREKGFGVGTGTEGAEAGSAFYESNVTISFFEVYDELFTDLLKPGTNALAVALDPHRGFCIPGLRRQKVVSAVEARRAIAAGKRSRRMQKRPSGPSSEVSAAGMLLEVRKQGEGAFEAACVAPLAYFSPSSSAVFSSKYALRLSRDKANLQLHFSARIALFSS